VAAGDAHSLCLTYDNKVFSWGFSNAGQLGLGVTDESQDYVIFRPTLIESLKDQKII